MNIKKISVIGLGLMGTPLATLLLKAGYRVKGFDLVKEKMGNLIPLGLQPVNSPQEAADEADMIMLSLPNWEAVLEVVEGQEGILSGSHKGQIVLDTGTSPPAESLALGLRLAPRGIQWMDAPISGSSAQALVGNIVFMIGGQRAAFTKIRPLLEKIAKKVIYVGKLGQAATMKLVINHVLYLNQAAAIEGLVLGLKAGFNPDLLFEAISCGAAASDLIISRGKEMLQGNFSPKGPLIIANKDLALSLELAKKLGVPLPLGALYQQFLLQAHYQGWDMADATVVMRLYEQWAGLGRKTRPSKKFKKTKV